jgi:acetyl-CoA C-acetyltransferase
MANDNDPIVIVGSARTPIGGLLGVLSGLTAIDLGAHAIKHAIKRSNLKSTEIEEVFMGCVLPAGLGQAPARQAAIAAEIPISTACTTINKMCGSGMKTVMLAHDLLLNHSRKIILAGGMESMSHAPYLLDKARSGYRLGHQILIDHLYRDGLEDAYDKGKLMGVFAEITAEKYGFDRVSSDAFALSSLTRAKIATENKWFLNDIEIAPITVDDKIMDTDELPIRAKPEKIPQLKSAFKENGTVTAANSSSISDGAAALVLMRQSEALKRGIKPIATILGHSEFSQESAWFTTAPIKAIEQLLKKLNWTADTPDLYEINEAFAVVVMAAMQDLNLPVLKVNIHGGACALGHPIGASGTRIICTLLSALQRTGKKRGIASLCIGGGEATAIAVEMA